MSLVFALDIPPTPDRAAHTAVRCTALLQRSLASRVRFRDQPRASRTAAGRLQPRPPAAMHPPGPGQVVDEAVLI